MDFDEIVLMDFYGILSRERSDSLEKFFGRLKPKFKITKRSTYLEMLRLDFDLYFILSLSIN